MTTRYLGATMTTGLALALLLSGCGGESEPESAPKPEELTYAPTGVVETVDAHEWVDFYDDARAEWLSCSIKAGATLHELALDDSESSADEPGASSLVHVRYDAEAQETGGAPCDTGVEFDIDRKLFVGMTERYEANNQAVEENSQVVEQLRENPVKQPRTQVNDQFMWVDIEPRGLEHDSCSIQPGDVVHEIGTHEDRVLLRLDSSVMGSGNSCDGGTVFFVYESIFSTMNDEYARIEAAAKTRQQTVTKLLDNQLDNGRTAVVDDTLQGWVDQEIAIAPKEITDWRAFLSERQPSCIVNVGATLTEIGTHDNKVLVEYDAGATDTLGTNCDDGVIFFVPETAFG